MSVANKSFVTNCIFTTRVGTPSQIPQPPEQSSGSFPQRIQGLVLDLNNRMGTQEWKSTMADGGITFIQKKIFEPTNAVPYLVNVSYTPYVGSAIYQLENPLQLPFTPSTGLLSLPLWLNGIPNGTAYYNLTQAVQGSLDLSLSPITTVTNDERVGILIIEVVANMCLEYNSEYTGLTPIYVDTLQKTFKITPFPNTANLQFSLPNWLQYAYWIQNVWATENFTKRETMAAPSLRPILSYQNQNLTRMDGVATQGFPVAVFQTETSAMDAIYFGSGSTGQTLSVSLLIELNHNDSALEVSSQFYQKSLSSSHRLNSAQQIMFRIINRYEQPYNSLTATYDIIQKAIIEAYRNDGSNA
jgi:hypothetical protein